MFPLTIPRPIPSGQIAIPAPSLISHTDIEVWLQSWYIWDLTFPGYSVEGSSELRLAWACVPTVRRCGKLNPQRMVTWSAPAMGIIMEPLVSSPALAAMNYRVALPEYVSPTWLGLARSPPVQVRVQPSLSPAAEPGNSLVLDSSTGRMVSLYILQKVQCHPSSSDRWKLSLDPWCRSSHPPSSFVSASSDFPFRNFLM